MSVCDSKLLSTAILALAAARPDLSQQGTPSPSSSSLSPSSRSPSRSPSRHSTSPSRGGTSPSAEGAKNKRSSFRADLPEEEWVREECLSASVCFHILCRLCVDCFACGQDKICLNVDKSLECVIQKVDRLLQRDKLQSDSSSEDVFLLASEEPKNTRKGTSSNSSFAVCWKGSDAVCSSALICIHCFLVCSHHSVLSWSAHI